MNALGDSLASAFFQRALLEVVVVGAVAGVVGVHVILRRLPFFVVAMSHATFPGVVLASLLGVSLLLGAAAVGLLVVIAVVALGTVRALDESSAIGVVLAGSFAAGVLVLSSRTTGSRDLSAFLVGSVLTVSATDLMVSAAIGALVLAAVGATHKELVIGAFDPGGAAAAGYRVPAIDLLALVVVTVTMVIAVPAVGTLLAIALLTVPPLTARLWVDRIGPMMAIAAGIGAVSGAVGLCLSAAWGVAAGGAIALTAVAGFVVSAGVRRVVVAAG